MHNKQAEITVLIAEDSTILRENIKTILSFEKDISVIGTVTNGSAAVDFIKHSQPDVILMDIEMETKTDGIVATNDILHRYPDIKIIMLTIQENTDIILSAYSGGACDYVLKTASASEIIDAVRAAYNNASPIRPIIASKIRGELKSIKNTRKDLVNILKVVFMLTPTELSILKHVRKGKKQSEIAKIKQIGLSTVKTHIRHILRKFEAKKSSDVVQTLDDNNIFDILEEFNKDDDSVN